MKLCLALSLGLALTGCFAPRHEIVGRACDPEHPCGEDLVCGPDGRCALRGADQADAGTLQNALPNGGFEEGLVGWRPSGDGADLELEETTVRTGRFAVRVAASSTAASRMGITLSPGISGTAAGQTWCAEAWLWRGTVRTPIALSVRGWDQVGGWDDSSTLATPTEDAWTVIRAKKTLAPPFDHSVNLRLNVDYQPGGYFLVDDVRLWHSATSDCDG